MPEHYGVLAAQIMKNIAAQIAASNNQHFTTQHIIDTNISGYRSLHAYQVYKRGRLLNNFAIIGMAGSGTYVGL